MISPDNITTLVLEYTVYLWCPNGIRVSRLKFVEGRHKVLLLYDHPRHRQVLLLIVSEQTAAITTNTQNKHLVLIQARGPRYNNNIRGELAENELKVGMVMDEKN